MSIQHFASNRIGKVLRKTLNGKEYLVVPMRMIVPGVLNGSAGPILYTKNELEKNFQAWNGMPLVVYHPKDSDGKPISARSPDVLNAQGIGFIFNTSVDSGNLDAEAWIDIEAANRVDQRILPTITANQKMELSTGLFHRPVKAEDGAVFNGKPYEHKASDIIPDHLAFLPDQKGACSLTDGCGVLVNECNCEDPNLCECQNSELPVAVQDWMTANNVTFYAGRSTPPRESQEEIIPMATKALVDQLVGNCDCWTENDREVLNDFADDKLKQLINANDLARQAGKAKEVLVNGIEVGDMKFAFNMDADKWEPVKQEPKTVVENSKPSTFKEWMDAAPPELAQIINRTLASEKAEHDDLVEYLVDNADGDKAFLESQDLETLRSIKEMVKPKQVDNVAPKSLTTYLSGGSVTNNQSKSKKTKSKPLGLPSLDM